MNKKTITIPLKKATYEDIQALNIDLQTQLLVKDSIIKDLDKEIKRLNGLVKYTIKPSYTTRKLKEQQHEIEKLNNIINELEKWLIEEKNYYLENYYYSDFNAYATYIDVILNKLKELKENK